MVHLKIPCIYLSSFYYTRNVKSRQTYTDVRNTNVRVVIEVTQWTA